MDHRRGRLLVALVVACAAALGFGPAGSARSAPVSTTGAGSGWATGSVPTGDHAPPGWVGTSQVAPRAGLPLTGSDASAWPLTTPPAAAWASVGTLGGGAVQVGGAQVAGAEHVRVVGARAPPAQAGPVTGQRPAPPTA